MNTLTIAGNELRRLLSGRRGIFALAGFLIIWIAVLNYVIVPLSSPQAGGFDFTELFDIMLYSVGTNKWPAIEVSAYWQMSLYLLPLVALMISADQTASDRSRGTLRFLVLRCSRWEVFLGRFLGQCVIMSLIVIVTLGSVLVVIAVNSSELLSQSVAYTPLIIVNLILVVLPYIALMALVSVIAKSAMQSTFYAIVLWVAALLLIGFLEKHLGRAPILSWLMPGAQTDELRRSSDWQMLSYAIIPVLQAGVLLLLGGFMMQRRSL